MTEPSPKRRRLSPELEEEIAEIDETTVSRAPAFNEEPIHLISCAVVQALEHVGFDGASKEALDAFCSEVDEYMTHLLAYVTESMLCSRRSYPTPFDFGYALRRDGLDKIALRPHLKPPVKQLRPQRELASPVDDPTPTTVTKLLGSELSGREDQLQKRYIPKKFPAFPARHTYKWTESATNREIDPRRIREKATEAARYGEDALRRLVKASKTGGQKELRRAANSTTLHRQRHGLWRQTMQSLSSSNGISMALEGGADVGVDENGTIVNAERHYWRKGMAPTKKVLGESRE